MDLVRLEEQLGLCRDFMGVVAGDCGRYLLLDVDNLVDWGRDGAENGMEKVAAIEDAGGGGKDDGDNDDKWLEDALMS